MVKNLIIALIITAIVGLGLYVRYEYKNQPLMMQEETLTFGNKEVIL